MKHRSKRLLSILLSLVLVLGLVPGMSLTAYAAEYTSLQQGDVLYLGDTIDSTTKYQIGDGWLPSTLRPWTLVRGNITGPNPEDITESDGSAYGGIKMGPGGLDGGYWPVTATSDGISVTSVNEGQYATTVTFAVHEAPVTTTYTVTVIPGANGAAGVSQNEAAEGTLVEVTPITPFSGYELDKITLSYGGSEYDITEAKSFQMPAANVTVTVTFKPVGGSGGGGEGGGASGGGDYSGGGYYAAPRAYRASLTATAGGSAYLLLSSGESGTSMNVVPTSLVWVVATPDPGYVVDSIVCVPGGDITNGPSFVMPYGNVTVTVTFKPAA